jgi:O-antigen/teichoic acid export membrane protein
LLVPEWGLLLMAASVSIPLIMSALLGSWWVKGDPALHESSDWSDSRPEQVSMTAVALLIQACLSTAPLWLSRQSPDAAVAGAFVTVTAYMRSPSILAGGLMAPLLTAAAFAFADGRPRTVAAKTVRALTIGVLGSSLLVLLLLALSSVGMLILYGGDTGLPTATFVWLGASTIGYVAANVLTNSLFGCQQARVTALVWVAPALISMVLYAVADGRPTWLAAASAIGQALAVVLLGGTLALVLRPRLP